MADSIEKIVGEMLSADPRYNVDAPNWATRLRSVQSVAVDDGVAMIAAERRRQIDVERWEPDHDDEHDTEELAFAAACYVTAGPGDEPPAVWPWDWKWWKPRDRISNLVRAGALIAAEIDRLKRAALAAALENKDG